MAGRSAGLSGTAVGLAGAGALLLLAGLKNTTVSATLRAMIKGQPLPSGASDLAQAQGEVGATLGQIVGQGASAAAGLASGDVGAIIAKQALSYVGAPYQWAAAGPTRFDCSGLVTWVLHHDLGLNLPSNSHTVTGQFYVWSGAVTVPRPPQIGDLICWLGHIGIAISPTQMVHAPSPGQRVQVSNIWWTPAPLVRRVKAEAQHLPGGSVVIGVPGFGSAG